MIIDQHILDELTGRAKASPRMRMNLDLRNSPEDKSQRMLYAVEPESMLPTIDTGRLRNAGRMPIEMVDICPVIGIWRVA